MIPSLHPLSPETGYQSSLLKRRKLNFTSSRNDKITAASQQSIPIEIRPKDHSFHGKSKDLKSRQITIGVNPLFGHRNKKNVSDGFSSDKKSNPKQELPSNVKFQPTSGSSKTGEGSYFTEMPDIQKMMIEEKFQRLKKEDLDFEFSPTPESKQMDFFLGKDCQSKENKETSNMDISY